MKGEGRPYSFRTNYSVNSQAFVLEVHKLIEKKNTSEVKLAERKSALLQNNKVWKKILPFVQLQGNRTVASPKEQLYEPMTSNPALTERNTQKANAYLLDSRPEQKSVVTYRTILYQACTYVFGLSTLWLQQRRLDLR